MAEPLTRRGVIAALLPLAVLAQKEETVSAQEPPVVKTKSVIWTRQPIRINFGLGEYKEYVFTLGDERVTFTPTEIMAILKGDT